MLNAHFFFSLCFMFLCSMLGKALCFNNTPLFDIEINNNNKTIDSSTKKYICCAYAYADACCCCFFFRGKVILSIIQVLLCFIYLSGIQEHRNIKHKKHKIA